MQSKKVIKTLVSTGSFQDFIENIFYIRERQGTGYVCFANVHMVVEAYKDQKFNQVVNNADLVTPDGRPLSIFMKLFYGIRQERVPGMDLLPVLLKEAEQRNKSVYFYGSTDEVLKLIGERIQKELPNLKLAGTYSPPFRTLTIQEQQKVVDTINNSGADLVFVALGCPKQENWMAEHKGKINAIMLGVGQAFMTYSGLEKRLPKWMRDLSLEWTYRLFLEPKRLWKRYLVTNSLFLMLISKFYLTRLIGRFKF